MRGRLLGENPVTGLAGVWKGSSLALCRPGKILREDDDRIDPCRVLRLLHLSPKMPRLSSIASLKYSLQRLSSFRPFSFWISFYKGDMINWLKKKAWLAWQELERPMATCRTTTMNLSWVSLILQRKVGSQGLLVPPEPSLSPASKSGSKSFQLLSHDYCGWVMNLAIKEYLQCRLFN